MADFGQIKKTDARRMAKGVVKIENLVLPKKQGMPISYSRNIIYAKITSNDEAGRYSADQVLVNTSTTDWEILEGGIVWSEGEGGAEQLFEMNFSDALEVDNIVEVIQTNIAGLGGDPKWVIVSAGLGTADCQSEIVYAVTKATFDIGILVPTDPVTFGDLTEFNLAFCEPAPCGPDPEMSLTVSNLGATETINWCGEIWNLPGDNGLTKQVCPTKYTNTLNGTGAITQHSWNYNYSLWLLRYRSVTTTFNQTKWRNQVQINPSINAVSQGGNSYFNLTKTVGGSFTFYSKVPSFTPVYPAYAIGGSTATNLIPDSWFFSWTVNNVTFTHERTDPAEWP